MEIKLEPESLMVTQIDEIWVKMGSVHFVGSARLVVENCSRNDANIPSSTPDAGVFLRTLYRQL